MRKLLIVLFFTSIILTSYYQYSRANTQPKNLMCYNNENCLVSTFDTIPKKNIKQHTDSVKKKIQENLKSTPNPKKKVQPKIL